MAQQLKRNNGKKRKGKIKFKQTARLVEKNDATRVAKADTSAYPRMHAQIPRSNGAVFKIKVKRK